MYKLIRHFSLYGLALPFSEVKMNDLRNADSIGFYARIHISGQFHRSRVLHSGQRIRAIMHASVESKRTHYPVIRSLLMFNERLLASVLIIRRTNELHMYTLVSS